MIKLVILSSIICITSIIAELIIWKYKPKQFIEINTRFERKCQTNRPLTIDEHLSWIIYDYNGRINLIEHSNYIIDSFKINNEGINICQIKDNNGKIIDEKFFFLTNDPTDLINEQFEGYDQILIDSDLNDEERYCGPDQNIEYSNDILVDFHIDFIQHYERIRQHSNFIQLKNIKHENEGYYECIVRLYNGLVGIRVFFLSVGGGPRQISNRETHIYSDIDDSITLLCPIFSALPAWYTFINPDNSTIIGYDYLRIKHLTHSHSGMYICRVTTNQENEGYSRVANVYLDVYGSPEYIEPYKKEYVSILIRKTTMKIIRCSIYGNPKVDYQWFSGDIKERNQEEILSNEIDYIINEKKNDVLEYNQTITCIATNNRGYRRQVFSLQFIN